MAIQRSNSDNTAVEILFDPFPRQLEFLSAVFSFAFRVLFYGGAIRGGKTFAGLGTLILLSKMFPGSRWIVVRDTLQTLKRNTIPSFKKICPAAFCIGGSIDKAYNQELQTVTFTNGSQIIFFGENFDQDKDLYRWRGLECNGFLLEEINELQEKSFYKAIERAGTWIIPGADAKQPPPFVMATANPSRNWVKPLFYERFNAGNLPDDWFYLPARIFDNDKIPAAYLENLKSLPKYEYELFVLGNWDISIQAGDEFYRTFNLNRNTISNEIDTTGRPELYINTEPLYISFDENVNPYITATVWQIVKRDPGSLLWPDHVRDLFDDLGALVTKALIQIDEFCLTKPNNRIDPLCDRIADRYRGHVGGLFIHGDASSKKDDIKVAAGTTVFTMIAERLAEFNPVVMVPPSNPSVVMRGNFQNAVFECFFGGVAIFIGSNCRNSISDYLNVKTDSDGTKNKRKERDPVTKITFEPFGHTSDANDYFVISVLRDTFNEYLRGVPSNNATIVRRAEIKRKNSY